MMKEHLANKLVKKVVKPAEPKLALVVHAGYTCDRCGMQPITGIRYRCSVRPNYDLCEKCEAAEEQPHPMVKIRQPSKMPHQVVCDYQVSAPVVQASAPVLNKVYKSKCVTWHSAVTAKTDEHFTLSFCFENNGDEQWPNVEFIRITGEKVDVVSHSEIVSGKEFKVNFKAPSSPGSYWCTYRLKAEHEFGEKVHLNLNIISKPQEPVEEKSSLLDIIEKPQEEVPKMADDYGVPLEEIIANE
jgi:hypothetical protein